jgi:hypothetical protein
MLLFVISTVKEKEMYTLDSPSQKLNLLKDIIVFGSKMDQHQKGIHLICSQFNSPDL